MVNNQKISYTGGAEAAHPQEGKFGADLSFAAKEAYNLLRTNLLYTLPTDDTGRAIGITSSIPSEGKSFTSINLAYSIAESGQRVILVDTDMRRPSVAKSLGRTSSPGLSNLLVKKDSNVIHKKVLHDNLDMIFAGDIPPNPAELVGSSQMSSIVELLRQHYDYLIFDLPPVQAVSDPLIISKIIDGIILVVRHQTSRRREISDTVRQLKLVNAHILGFVYNGYGASGGYYYHKDYKYKNDYTSSK